MLEPRGFPMHLAHRSFGEGPTVLLIHGAAEDGDLLAPQARAIGARGFRVLSYDRRGTGGSTRADWPGRGAAQHADDAADLLHQLDAVPATVIGFSSGAVVALELALRHPDVATEVIAWEPAAVAVLPEGPAMHAGLLAPIESYLAEHPEDWTGAYRTMLDVLSEGRADHDDPLVVHMRRNAEAAIRDDAALITAQPFDDRLSAAAVTVAISREPNPLHGDIAHRLAGLSGRPVAVVAEADDHEIYLSRPDVLARWLVAR
jgi:pimeloyl-ACP methyl ester carboxylesterase